jgi:GH18 family chitinase
MMLSFLQRLAVIAILLATLPCHALRTDHSLRSTGATSRGHVNAVYFINWFVDPPNQAYSLVNTVRGIYGRSFYPQDIDISHISHVFYAFLGVKPDGTV